MPEITTWEGMPIPFPDGINARHVSERLLLLTESMPFTAFRWKRGMLYAAEVVGCIQIGNLRINILPKSDTQNSTRDKSFLINLLRSAGHLNQVYQDVANVRSNTQDPLEVIIGEVAADISEGLRKTSPKRYKKIAENSQLLRGRIDFVRLSTRLPGQAYLPISYWSLGTNNDLSQVIKGIAKLLYQITTNSVNRQKLNIILKKLSTTTDKTLYIRDLENIKLSKHESVWARVIATGSLLVKGQAPDPTFSGKESAFSLLFPLQHLYERTLRKILSEVTRPNGIKTTHHSEAVYLFTDTSNNQGIVRLKPDYTFKIDENIVAIGDAKWKRIKDTTSSYGIDRQDLYQIFSYLIKYNVKLAVVFCPKAPWMPSIWTKEFYDPGNLTRVVYISTDIESLISRNVDSRTLSRAALGDTLEKYFSS